MRMRQRFVVLLVLLMASVGRTTTLSEYEKQAGVGDSSQVVTALKQRLGFGQAQVNEQGMKAALASIPDQGGYRAATSITLKDLVPATVSDVQNLIELGAPMTFDSAKSREQRMADLQAHRNEICVAGLKKDSQSGQVSQVIDAILTKLARPEIDAIVAAAGTSLNSPVAAPTANSAQAASFTAISLELKRHLAGTIGDEKANRVMSTLGPIVEVEKRNGHLFRIGFQSKDTRVYLSLSILLTYLSGEDNGFVSTLDCLNQLLVEQKTLLGTSMTADAKKILERDFGTSFLTQDLQNRLNIALVLQPFIESKLDGALAVNSVMKTIGSGPSSGLLAAFLDLQKDEIPNPADLPRLSEMFQKLLEKPSADGQVERDYVQYRTIARLIRKLEQSADLREVNRKNLELDKQLFRVP